MAVAPVFVTPPQAPSLSLDPRLLGALYLVWGVALLVAAIRYIRRRRQPPRALAVGVGIGYQMTLWLIRLVGYRASYARMLWRRDLAVSLLFFVTITLLTWPFGQRERHR